MPNVSINFKVKKVKKKQFLLPLNIRNKRCEIERESFFLSGILNANCLLSRIGFGLHIYIDAHGTNCFFFSSSKQFLRLNGFWVRFAQTSIFNLNKKKNKMLFTLFNGLLHFRFTISVRKKKENKNIYALLRWAMSRLVKTHFSVIEIIFIGI